MAAPSWNISGQYFETCSCDYLCPCILGQMAVRPTKGSCTFAMAMQVERGTFGSVPLGGVTFIVLGYTPEEMVKGNWSVGLVVDERATAGKFLGVETAPITFERSGNKGSVKAGALVDMAAEGAMGIDPSVTEPLFIDHTGHPVSSRLSLARASKSHVTVLGLTWDDDSGKNNGHFAPFNWRSA